MVGVETRPLSIVKAGENPLEGILTPDVRKMLLGGGLSGIALAALAELVSSGRHRILKRRLRKRFPTSGKGVVLSIPSDERDFDKSSDTRSDMAALKNDVSGIKAEPAAGNEDRSTIDNLKGAWGGVKDTIQGAGATLKGLLDVLAGTGPEPKAWSINSPKFIPTALGSVGLATLAFYLTQKLLHSGRTPAQKAEDAARREFRRALLESEKRSHIMHPDEETGYYIVDQFADEFEKSGGLPTVGINTGLATAALAGYIAYSIEKKRRLKQLRQAWVDLQRTRNPRIEAQRVSRDVLSSPVGIRGPIPRALVKASGEGWDAVMDYIHRSTGSARQLVNQAIAPTSQQAISPELLEMLNQPKVKAVLPQLLELVSNNPKMLEKLPLLQPIFNDPELLATLQGLKPGDLQDFRSMRENPGKFLVGQIPQILGSVKDYMKEQATGLANNLGEDFLGAENYRGLFPNGIGPSLADAGKWWLKGGRGLFGQVGADLNLPAIPGATTGE